MNNNTPFSEIGNYPALTYLWVLWLSFWGASVAYLQKIKQKGPKGFSLWVFFVEIFTASLVGLITFYLCELQQIDGRLTAINIALASHMGTRAIFLISDKLFPMKLEEEK